MDLVKLRRDVDALRVLLDDPHPGLFAWCAAVQKIVEHIGYLTRTLSERCSQLAPR